MTSADASDRTADTEGGQVLRIVTAATRLFAERGFAATSSRDLAAACELNVATVAHHVGGKAALYAKVFDHIQQIELAAMAPVVLTALERLAVDLSCAIEAVTEVALAYLAFLADNPEVGRLWLRRILDVDPAGEHHKPANPNTAGYGLIEAKLVEAAAAGHVRPADFEAILRGFVWMAYAHLGDDPLVDGPLAGPRMAAFVADYVSTMLTPAGS